MYLEGVKSEAVEGVVTNPAVAARMGALEPRHFLTPAAVHAGVEATGDTPNVFGRFTGRVKDAIDDVTPG